MRLDCTRAPTTLNTTLETMPISNLDTVSVATDSLVLISLCDLNPLVE